METWEQIEMVLGCQPDFFIFQGDWLTEKHCESEPYREAIQRPMVLLLYNHCTGEVSGGQHILIYLG